MLSTWRLRTRLAIGVGLAAAMIATTAIAVVIDANQASELDRLATFAFRV